MGTTYGGLGDPHKMDVARVFWLHEMLRDDLKEIGQRNRRLKNKKAWPIGGQFAIFPGVTKKKG